MATSCWTDGLRLTVQGHRVCGSQVPFFCCSFGAMVSRCWRQVVLLAEIAKLFPTKRQITFGSVVGLQAPNFVHGPLEIPRLLIGFGISSGAMVSCLSPRPRCQTCPQCNSIKALCFLKTRQPLWLCLCRKTGGGAVMGRLKSRLSTGRPPLSQRPKSISRKRAKRVINEFHQLQKQSQSATQKGDIGAVEVFSSKLKALGGLDGYQQASLQGQRTDRGGDTSKVLMEWMKPLISDKIGARQSLKMLEVGALSTRNACSLSGCFDIERIDLNSQSPGISSQDFMQRPLPTGQSQCFDLISLSLVLNFVATPRSRGHMLKRTVAFLRSDRCQAKDGLGKILPALFLVLPAPCIGNSRYLNVGVLTAMMESLGYTLVRQRTTAKLYYSLWRLITDWQSPQVSFGKEVIHDGRSRNNFAIILGTDGS
jgi:25S rRNA (adenine2142-N1)-methyltransferase